MNYHTVLASLASDYIVSVIVIAVFLIILAATFWRGFILFTVAIGTSLATGFIISKFYDETLPKDEAMAINGLISGTCGFVMGTMFDAIIPAYPE